jgi:hypothetical protein
MMNGKRRRRFTAFEPASTHNSSENCSTHAPEPVGSGNIGVAESVVKRDGHE